MRSLICLLSFILYSSESVVVKDPPYEQLKITGKYLTKLDGTPVQLRGMSLYASDNPLGYIYWNNETMEQLKCNWNVNVVRLPMSIGYNGYLKDPEGNYERVANAIEAAIETGIYVIVDWHDFDWHLEQAIPFFANISQLYGKYPHVLYETYNEPSWADSWANLTVYHTAIIKAIRANDPDNVIIVGTPRSSIDVDIAAAAPLNFSNIAYTLHFYTNIPNTTWGGNIMEKAQKAIDMNLPIFVTEYGVCNANGQGPVEYNVSQMFWDFLDTNKISYLAWTISDDKGCYYTLKYPTTASQVGDRDYWTESGAYLNKKLWSTDQGLTCPTTCSCPSGNWYQSTVNPCNCYAFIQTPLNWNSANNVCRQQNPKATLTSIDSAFENNEILASGKNQTTCTQFFIGLERDISNAWYWSNNDTSKYLNWRTGYPNGNSNDKCSQLNTNDGKWTNIDCTTNGCYICEIKNL